MRIKMSAFARMNDVSTQQVGGRVDLEGARAGAYAEKPVREAINDKYGDYGTVPEGVPHSEGYDAAVDIVNRVGDAAIQAFKESQSLEDPRIDALRLLVTQQYQIEGMNRSSIERDTKQNRLGDEASRNITKFFVELGNLLLDRDLARGIDIQTLFGVHNIAFICLNRGLLLGRMQAQDLSSLSEQYSDLDPKYRAGNQLIFYGFFAAKLFIYPEKRMAVETLLEIDKRNGVTEGLSADHLALLARFRDKVNADPGASGGVQRQGPLDRAMVEKGYFWSPRTGQYVQGLAITQR
jgi:hypothetical protein